MVFIMTNYHIPPEKIQKMLKEADSKETLGDDILNILGGLWLFFMIWLVSIFLHNITIPELLLKIICYSIAIGASIKMLNLIGTLINSSTKQ